MQREEEAGGYRSWELRAMTRSTQWAPMGNYERRVCGHLQIAALGGKFTPLSRAERECVLYICD